MNENQPLKLYHLSEDLISQICDFFFAAPLTIGYPFPALSCISCSDYTSLICLVHTNRKLRDLIRNNTDLWSRCLFRFPCFLDINCKLCKKLIVICDENYSNLNIPTYESYSNSKEVDYYMGEVSNSSTINDESFLEKLKEGKIPSNVNLSVEEKRNKTFHYFSCESQLLDAYSEFINVLCDTSNMDIYFEGFNHLPQELHKKKENQVTIRNYHEKFPHIRCVSFRQQSGYVEGDYWFYSNIEFDKKSWWHEMEGIVVSYSSFFSLQNVLDPLTDETSEKSKMKRVRMNINLGEGKSNVLLDDITDFVKDYPNIQVMTTVFATEPQCFSVLYQHLKRVSLSLKSVPEEMIVLKDVSLPYLTWLDLHGKYQQELDPITQTLKLHHIKFDNVYAPMLFYLELDYIELSVENQKPFSMLKTLDLKFSKFRKDFLIDKHYSSLENLTVRNCVEVYNQKLDLYLDSKFYKLESFKVTEGRNIQALYLAKLDNIEVTSSLTFHAKDCKLTSCKFNSVTESINIEQPSHPISTSFYMYQNPQMLSLSSPSCNILYLGIQKIENQSIFEVNVGEISNFSVQIYNSSSTTINHPSNFLINTCKIDTLELNIDNTNKTLLDILVNNLNQVSSIRKIKFSYMTSDTMNQFWSNISGPKEYKAVEFKSNGFLYMCYTRTLSNISLESSLIDPLSIFSIPGLTKASVTIYSDTNNQLPVIESSTLNTLTVASSGNKSLIYFPIDFQKLCNLETLTISQQTLFSNNSTSILKKLTISSSQTLELDMSLLPLLTNLKISTCQTLKLHYSKQMDDSKLTFIHINLIDTFNVELPSWSLLSLKEVLITKIKNTTANTLLDLTGTKCISKIVHLPQRYLK